MRPMKFSMRMKTGIALSFLLALVWIYLPGTAAAQAVMVGKFSDRSGLGLGRSVRSAIAKALERKGADLVSYSKYLKRAKRYRISKKRAFSRRSIRKIARRMGIKGVVTGTVERRSVTVKLYGPNGRLWAKDVHSIRRSGLSPGRADRVAAAIMKHLGPGDERDLPLESAPEEPIAEEPLAHRDDKALSMTEPMGIMEPMGLEEPPSNDGGSPLPGIDGERSDDRPKSLKTPPAASKRETSPFVGPGDRQALAHSDDWASDSKPKPEIRKRAPRRRSKSGPVPQALLTAGVAMHLRSGLEPLHTTDAFTGLRFDGHLFLGAFSKEPILRDLGLRFSVDFDLGLQYRYRGQDAWFDADQILWHAELLYRLVLRGKWMPNLLLKLGVGGVESTIDEEAIYGVDATYLGPRLGIDAHWILIDPWLRASLGLAVLVTSIGGDLDATGGGIQFFAGFDGLMLGFLHASAGYQVTWYGFDDEATGSTSDTYHGLFLRLGYSYR